MGHSEAGGEDCGDSAALLYWSGTGCSEKQRTGGPERGKGAHGALGVSLERKPLCPVSRLQRAPSLGGPVQHCVRFCPQLSARAVTSACPAPWGQGVSVPVTPRALLGTNICLGRALINAGEAQQSPTEKEFPLSGFVSPCTPNSLLGPTPSGLMNANS